MPSTARILSIRCRNECCAPASSKLKLIVSSRLVEDVERREMSLLQELQRRPAARADVADLVRQLEFLDRRGAVAAADDGDGVALLRCVGDGLGNLLGAVLEWLLLEHAHRPVPDDRAGLGDLVT